MSGPPQLFSPSELSNQPSPRLSDPNPCDPQLPESDPPESRLSAQKHFRTAPIWLQRLSLFVLVLFCVYLGVFVVILPWWTRMWDNNALILAHPTVAAFLFNGAVRGIISGLGLLDIWIGISEAVHYRDYRGE